MTVLRVQITILTLLMTAFGSKSAFANLLLSPLEAIEASKTTPNTCVAVSVRMDVRGSGIADGRLYLNSEINYRSPKSLNVAIQPSVVSTMMKDTQISPKDYFLNRCIIVTGKLCQVGIYIRGQGHEKPAYYQSQLPVFDPSQIEMCEDLIV